MATAVGADMPYAALFFNAQRLGRHWPLFVLVRGIKLKMSWKLEGLLSIV